MYDTLIFNDILKIICAHYLSIPGIITARSGQREPHRLVLEVGGTSSTSLGGSRWPDPAVYLKHIYNIFSSAEDLLIQTQIKNGCLAKAPPSTS